MQVLEFLKIEYIKTPLDAKTREEAIIELVGLLERGNQVNEDEYFASRVIKREDAVSTHIYPEVAFPHARSVTAPRPCLAIGKTASPIPWDGPGGGNVRLVILIMVPESAGGLHVEILQELMGLFHSTAVCDAILGQHDADSIYNLLRHIDVGFGIPRGFSLKGVLTGGQQFVHCLAWSHDGRWLAGGGPARDECRVWEAETGRMVAILRGHGGPVYAVAWSPDGRHVATGCADHLIRLYSVSNHFSQCRVINTNAEVYGIAWSPDSLRLASAGHFFTARLWNAVSGAAEPSIATGTNLGYCVRWSPNGDFLAAGAGRFDPSVWVWNVRTGHRVVHLELRNGSVFALAWSPKSKCLAAAAEDGSIVIIDATTWQEQTTVRGHGRQPTALDFSFDGRLLASKADDGVVAIWNTQDWRKIAELPEPGPQHQLFNGLAFHPSRLDLATLGNLGRSIRVWNVDYEQLVEEPSVRSSAGLTELPKGTIEQKRKEGMYDVFLCHSSQDKDSVMAIGRRLLDRGILPWLDEWEVRPGTSWLVAIQEKISSLPSVAIFVGANGIGPWQQEEVHSLIRKFIENGRPCIPVVLEGCPNVPALPAFLSSMRWVDFRNRNADSMAELIWGITGTLDCGAAAPRTPPVASPSEMHGRASMPRGAVSVLPAMVAATSMQRQVVTAIEFTLDRPLHSFDENLFKSAFQSATGIDAGQIRISSIREGSTIVSVEASPDVLEQTLDRLQQSPEALHKLAASTGLTKVQWSIDGCNYELLVKATSAPFTYKYDAFISYRHQEPDKKFARDLLRRLETEGLKIAFDERDFDPVATFLQEMERCIKESRFTLAIVSPRYLQSGNCAEEAIVCKVLDMAERRRRLIPLTIEAVTTPVWLYDVVGIDFTDPNPLINAHDRLLEKLRLSR